MKIALLFICLVVGINSTFSQDVIIKLDGTEIESSVIELGTEEIKYKNFNNIDGPTYIILKSEVLKIKFENGDEVLFTSNGSQAALNEVPKQRYTRKGYHVGVFGTLGLGTFDRNDTYAYDYGFSFQTGFTFDISFTDVIGIKTGISLMQISINQSDYVLYSPDSASLSLFVYSNEGHAGYLGIPLNLSIITGKEVGFYFEAGFGFYIPIYTTPLIIPSVVHNNGSTYLEFEEKNITKNYILVNAESIIGINVNASNGLNIKGGVSINYSLNKEPKINLYGINIGVTYKIKQKKGL